MMADLPAHDGEAALALDELPPEAEAEDCVAIFEDVHAEGIAAVMVGVPADAPIYGGQSWRMDQEPRPRSGPASPERGGR